jgi:ribulose-5-phosphate 4-epimerase/fuculose-1-phosphate aldolase
VRFAFASDRSSPFLGSLVESLGRELRGRGHTVHPGAEPAQVPPDADVVFNVTDAADPRPNFFRRSASQFVCTLAETESSSGDLLREAYRVLVRTMSNLVSYTVHDREKPASYLITPELGCSRLPHGPHLASRLADEVLAKADVRLVTENDLVEDLRPELWSGDASTETMIRVGRRLDRLGLLPSILPLEELLAERERRMLFKLFGIRQLSYGNFSVRHDANSFWMTGRGADKGNLQGVGRDIFLVTGYDPGRNAMRLSVAPGTDPASRVSVDAIEHWVVYRTLPAVGAILHVHAWMDGIPSTQQSYPCGSYELALEVVGLLERATDPARAVVGLRNHGITATGPDLETLFETLAPRLERRVPMV